MAQRYKDPEALKHMAAGLCPECGQQPDAHSTDSRFWVRGGCSLLPHGVTARLAQYQSDLDGAE